jgi:hypothetical protein
MPAQPLEARPPVDRYKAITANLTERAEGLRETDRKRSVELAEKIAEADAAMEGAQKRAALSRAVVQVHWEAALEALWGESWLRLRPRPRPDPDVDPSRLDELEENLVRCSADLHAALQRRWSLRLSR